MEQDDIALECPGYGVFPRGFAVTRDLRDEIVGEPELLRQPAKTVDDAVRRPERRARADARRDLLVEHPVGEEFRMVWREKVALPSPQTDSELLLARRKIDGADVAHAAQAEKALEHEGAVDRRHRADQPIARLGRRRRRRAGSSCLPDPRRHRPSRPVRPCRSSPSRAGIPRRSARGCRRWRRVSTPARSRPVMS